MRKRRGKSPAERFAAFQVPKCSMTVWGWTASLGVLRELAHRRRASEPFARPRGAPRGSPRPSNDGASPARNAASSASSIRNWSHACVRAGRAILAISLERSDNSARSSERARAPPRLSTLAADGRSTRVETAGRARRGRALARGGPRWRHHTSREAPVEARSRSRRRARGAVAGGQRARLRDQREDDDYGDGGADPRAAAHALRGTSPARTCSRGSRPRSSPARRAELGLFEVDEAALPEATARLRPRVVALVEPLPRPARPLRRARARRRALASCDRGSPRRRRCSSSTPTTPSSRSRRRAPRALRFGLDDPRHARPALQHAADSKYCIRCGTPYEYARGLRRPPRRLPVPRLWARAALARRRRAGDRAPRAGRLAVPARCACRRRDRSSFALPGLYNVYNADAAASLALALGASLSDVRDRASRAFSAAFGRFERIADRWENRRRPPDQESRRGRTRRCARSRRASRRFSCSRSTTRSPTAGTSRGSGTSTSSRSSNTSTASSRRGERAAELGLRLTLRRPSAASGSRSSRRSSSALDRGLALVDAGTELVVLPTYTAMLALREILASAGLVRPYWEGERS